VKTSAPQPAIGPRYDIEGQYGTHQPRHEPRVRQIPLVLRGYDVAEVDNLLARAERALASRRELELAQARQALRSTTFNRRLRGYSPSAVQSILAQIGRQLGTA
jgi:hypothetical protein